MLVCDSNVRGIRERNKLGLIIMSADVNPYKNKSSLLFFSPPPTDQTTWAGCSCPDRRSSSTRVLNTSPVRCRHAECRSSVSLSPLISQRNVWSKTDFTDGAVSHKKKKQNPQWSLHLQRFTVRHTVMWGRLHRENNRYLRWMQLLGLLFLVLLFFNLFTRSSFLISWSGDITFKMPQYVLCCSHSKRRCTLPDKHKWP